MISAANMLADCRRPSPVSDSVAEAVCAQELGLVLACLKPNQLSFLYISTAALANGGRCTGELTCRGTIDAGSDTHPAISIWEQQIRRHRKSGCQTGFQQTRMQDLSRLVCLVADLSIVAVRQLQQRQSEDAPAVLTHAGLCAQSACSGCDGAMHL